MLSIKPVIEVRDGVVEEAGKVRTRSKALKLLAAEGAEGKIEHLAVLHGNAPDLDELLELLGAGVPPRRDRHRRRSARSSAPTPARVSSE